MRGTSQAAEHLGVHLSDRPAHQAAAQLVLEIAQLREGLGALRQGVLELGLAVAPRWQLHQELLCLAWSAPAPGGAAASSERGLVNHIHSLITRGALERMR